MRLVSSVYGNSSIYSLNKHKQSKYTGKKRGKIMNRKQRRKNERDIVKEFK